MLIDKRSGQTRAGYTKCACGEWSRCRCAKDTRSKDERYVDEVVAFDKQMKRNVDPDKRRDRTRLTASDELKAAAKKVRGR